jgi:hypothetical protein
MDVLVSVDEIRRPAEGPETSRTGSVSAVSASDRAGGAIRRRVREVQECAIGGDGPIGVVAGQVGAVGEVQSDAAR